MKTRTRIASVLTLGAALAGCATTPPPSPAAAAPARRAARDVRAETVTLRVAIRDLATRGAVASTDLALEPLRSVGFRTFERGSDANAELRVRVEPHGERAYAVAVEWDEVTPEGRHVRWAPTVAIAPGAAGTAQIAWAEGQGRQLELAVDRAPERAK